MGVTSLRLARKTKATMFCPQYFSVVALLLTLVAESGAQVAQSRESDMRIQFELEEGSPPGTVVGTIPTKPNFVYRFNDNPPEFYLNSTTGVITTSLVIDRESVPSDKFDLVILSSSPTYPIEVRIFILDINDNAPTFPEPSIHVSFSESANIGTRVILDTATDADVGMNDITTDYKIVSGNSEDKFRLVVTTNPSGEMPYLHLETMSKLDREVQDFYQLNLSAQDGGIPPKMGYLQVNISILDVNDNPPIFDHSDYSVSLNESVAPGTSVLQVRATDNDIDDNAKITYYLGESETQFMVDPLTGVISTLDYLNCQQNCLSGDSSCPKSCVFTVYARDHGSPRQDGRAYITVNLLDANDNDPIIRFRYFTTPALYATVDENAQNGSVVAAVSIIDVDEGLNGETTVEIKGGNELNHFSLLNSSSFHIVRVNGVLDREKISKYNLTITATDKGTPPRSSTAFLIIHVNDVNDHEPVFEKNEYSTFLSESVSKGSFVASIMATDEDTGINSNIYYTIVTGNDRGWFAIDIQTGLVTTISRLDREEQDFVELKISARDGGPSPKWAYTLLKIQILDENDEAPKFTQECYNVSLSENSGPGTLVTVVSAVDNDLGTNGTITYSFSSFVEKRYPGHFEIDPTYGRIITKIELDREAMELYELEVVASDQGNPSLTSTALIHLNILDVNDNVPEFYPSMYFASIKKDTAPGTKVVQVQAHDKDLGPNAEIVYSITSEVDDLFEIDQKSGVIRTKNEFRNFLKTKYEIIVSARNPSEKDTFENALVYITSNEHVKKPEFSNPTGYEFSIEEDNASKEPRLKREVGRVSLTSEFLEPFKYAIVSGDSCRCFKIDERSGVITTLKSIDRDTNPEVHLVVVAYSNSWYAQTSVKIHISDLNDYPPTFVVFPRKIEISEDYPLRKEIYKIEAIDLDAPPNNEIHYSLTKNPKELLMIEEETGIIRINKHPKVIGTHTVEVLARDSGLPALSSTQQFSLIIKDINDKTPVFDYVSYETFITESTPVNERFFSLWATDSDQGENGRVSYSIIEGNEEFKFGIFPDGFLYVKNSLDREKRDYYAMTIQAKDNGTVPRSSTTSIAIHVMDENDNPPRFVNSSFDFYIPENEPPESYVGRLVADDLDKGRNADLTYSFNFNQNDFMVDPQNGVIRTLNSFDRESLMEVSGYSYFVLDAHVIDGGIHRLSDDAKVTIHITDVNDNAPQFIRTPYKIAISENTLVKTLVLKVMAVDIDDDLNGNILYDIMGGNEGETFSIDEITGQITLSKPMDRERYETYHLSVIARDMGVDVSFTATTTVTIDVLDENDNAPTFLPGKRLVEIPEDTPIGFNIFNFSAVDVDLGINKEVVYHIASGNLKDTFKIDSSTGKFYLSRSLDYEENTVFHVNVSASDLGAPRQSSTIQFTVKVKDLNDNPPVFPNVAIVRQIEENVAVNTALVTVTAEDKDSGLNGEVFYQIVNQDPPGKHFGIKPETGLVYTMQPLDREFCDMFKLTVKATDKALPETTRLSSEKTITIVVEDINDNAPTFVSVDAGVLPANSNRGHVLMTLLAVDPDANMNGMVTYELVEGNTNLFYLDRNTGELCLAKDIGQPSVTYSLTIQASDEAALVSYRKSSRSKITVIGVSNSQNNPVFTSSEYSGSVYENERIGTSILTVQAHYPHKLQGPRGGTLRYFLTGIYSGGVSQKRIFVINQDNGILSTAEVLDRESGPEVFELEICVVDISASTPSSSRAKLMGNHFKDILPRPKQNIWREKMSILLLSCPMKSLRCLHTSLSQQPQCSLSWLCKAAVLGPCQISVVVVSNEEPQMSPCLSITAAAMFSILSV
ncbi:FAT4 [Cordylochernes scorpioides]|uniref:FAT4 n=1 Tax=Cordylochernes scorpioides TaxID=51811 RepID=A0ABY6K9F9_9ARAC|nr:FAT4 [Cordylochernes scorpioides]